MTRCYIAGPIRKGNLADNIKRATDIGYAFAKLGYAIMVPHLSCYFDGPDPNAEMIFHGRKDSMWVNDDSVWPQAENRLNADEWLAIDLAWVEVSDVVIRILGESEGADAEVIHAEHFGIPVFFVNSVDDVIGVHDQIQQMEELAI